jgi:Bacterial Ig-like domain (group 3)
MTCIRPAVVLAVVLSALLLGAGLAPLARAGTYDVVACNSAPGAVNNSWTPATVTSGGTPGITSYQCPAADTETTRGMRSHTPAFATLGTTATWTFQAPPGSSIVSVARSWHLYRTFAGWWVGLVYTGAHGYTHIDGYRHGTSPNALDTGPTFSPLQSVAVPNTSHIRLLAGCGAQGCTGSAAASMKDISVRVQDSSSPTVNVTGGSLAAESWHRTGNADVRFDATDNVGIRVATLSVDGVEKARRDFACDFTRPAPCSDQLGQTFSVNTATLTEGVHTARLTVVDTAGNTAIQDRLLKVDRTGPTLELAGSLKPEGHSWVARGEQDLAIDAADAASGAVSTSWQVFGVPGSTQQPCPQGGCDLYADVIADTSQKAESTHTFTATATDAAGNSSTQSWTVKVERKAPALTLSGTLKAKAGQTLAAGGTYTLTASATDTAGVPGQAGLGRLEYTVDDESPTVVEQACPAGRCALSRNFSYAVNNFDDGEHTITVTATDTAGNETTQSFMVINPEGPPPGCAAAPAPTLTTPGVAPIAPQTALDSFRTQIPQAFDRWTPVDFAGVVVQPKLDGSSPGAFEAKSSVAPMAVDKQVSDGATTSVRTDEHAICATPRIVSTSASSPTAVIDETSTLYANSAAATDSLYKPSVGGTEVVQRLRQAAAPQQFSWHVNLEPGQQLKLLGDGSVAVVEPAPAGAPIVTTGLPVPAVPSISARKEALRDTRTHVEQAMAAFDRALEATPDDIVALLPKPWASDSAGQSIATSLSASGSIVSMQVSHGSGTATYPVVAGLQFLVGDALDEWVAMEADVDTADYTDADFVAQPGVTQTLPTPPQDDIPDDEFVFDPSSIDNPSAFEDEDLPAASDQTAEVPMAEPNAAASPAFTAAVGLTETHPAALYSQDRVALRPQAMRPVVPWRVTQMIERPRGSVERQRAERKRAFLWDSARGSQPTGYFTIAENSQHGVKTAQERTHGITTDVAIQFGKFSYRRKSDGQIVEYVDRAPRVWTYRRLLDEFLTRYRAVLLDAQGRPTGNLTPWNEPQLRSSPTRQAPVRAARYWAVANALCHPRGRPHLCANVVAGEYSGTRGDQTIQRTFRTRAGSRIVRTRNYQRIYADYLFGRLLVDYPRNTAGERRQRPAVWGYHTYDDANRHQRGLRGSSRWPITDRYYRRFRSNAYRLRDGSLPRVWITATGVFYHRNCGSSGSALFQQYCDVAGGPDKTAVLFGMRNQRNTLSAMLRKLARLPGPGVGRLYYYTLHDTANASAYEGPATVLGRGARAYDSGLIGSDADGDPGEPPESRYENQPHVARYSGASGFSRSLQPRLAFCVLRDRVVRRGRPATCSR